MSPNPHWLAAAGLPGMPHSSTPQLTTPMQQQQQQVHPHPQGLMHGGGYLPAHAPLQGHSHQQQVDLSSQIMQASDAKQLSFAAHHQAEELQHQALSAANYIRQHGMAAGMGNVASKAYQQQQQKYGGTLLQQQQLQQAYQLSRDGSG